MPNCKQCRGFINTAAAGDLCELCKAGHGTRARPAQAPAATYTGYEEARTAIRRGHAIGHALWLGVATKEQRDDFHLRPDPWEGPGEYQRVTFNDGRDVLVRLPCGMSLPVPKIESKPAPLPVTTRELLKQARDALVLGSDGPPQWGSLITAIDKHLGRPA